MAVTPSTIAVALGRATPESDSAEFAQWEMWIGDALMLIENRLGDDFADVDSGKLDYVVREAVVAHVRRPDDATQVEIAVDDARSSRTYRTSRGRITILDEWWELLFPDDGSSAFVIDTVNTGTSHLAWCSLFFGAVYCSCGVDIAGYPIFELYGIGS